MYCLVFDCFLLPKVHGMVSSQIHISVCAWLSTFSETSKHSFLPSVQIRSTLNVISTSKGDFNFKKLLQ